MNRRGFIANGLAAAGAAGAACAAGMPWRALGKDSPTAPLDASLSAFLSRHVAWNTAGTATAVAYAGIRRSRGELQRLLDAFSLIALGEFERWPSTTRRAFLVNAYNVWTLALIADAPADTGSIKDLGGFLQSPWKKAFIPFLGETRSLDDIEHDLLRGALGFNEPRIHFAVNCASIGCPALRPEAYTPDRWDAQLDDQTRRFLRDRTRNRVLQRDPLRLGISSIFDWYGDDFDSAGGVQGFLARYPEALDLAPAETAVLRAGGAHIAFLDYDWSLNDRALA